MQDTAKSFLSEVEESCRLKKEQIRNAPDRYEIKGDIYYVRGDGDDQADGLSPATAWRTLDRVSSADLCPGDGVLFRRGDLFRGFVKVQSGVTYAAYGEGEKPRFYGWDKPLTDAALWVEINPVHHIWQWQEPILDCGTLVFDDGAAHCRKLIPSYRDGTFVCRQDESRLFEMAKEMTEDLDMVCLYDARLTDKPSKGEDFPIPLMDNQSLGVLYLRCDRGNPAHVYRSIEALPRRSMFQVGSCANVTIENLCLKYIGIHAVAAGGTCVRGLRVAHCEIGWIGGTIQHYFGTDPNYPQGRRGTVTRYGNGVEIYGGCDGYTVENCYIYQVYDAGITHQITTGGKPYFMKNICYRDNLVEHCVYSIEYFLEKTRGDTESYIDHCTISDNILRYSGYGWGQQRHNTDTPAHIKGWSYENTAKNFTVCHNVFDRAAYRMVHLVARDDESCPYMSGNTYIQPPGHLLGQYGANREAEPPILLFDETAEDTIHQVLGDMEAKIYIITE